MSYSPFFEVLYDQRTPVGRLGRGTHYSVLRAPVWQDGALKPLEEAQLLDFAVIWDEDHDERVIEAIEQMAFKGLLAPVKFIGERKGTLAVLTEVAVLRGLSGEQYRDYQKRLHECTPADDPWPVVVDTVGGVDHSIIHAGSIDVETYLKHIELLHSLGLKPHTEHVSGRLGERIGEHRQAMAQAGETLLREPTDQDEIPFDPQSPKSSVHKKAGRSV